MIELYQFEECPYCHKVRQVLTDLNVDFIARSAPRGSKQRDLLEKLGGKQQVPFLVDTETGTMLYESDAIIRYLQEKFS